MVRVKQAAANYGNEAQRVILKNKVFSADNSQFINHQKTKIPVQFQGLGKTYLMERVGRR